MAWKDTQSIIAVEGFHLDLGNDHHRSFQDILIRICENGTVCLRAARLIEHYAQELPPEKLEFFENIINNTIPSLYDPINKISSIVENECLLIKHDFIKEQTVDALTILKEYTTNFSSKTNEKTYELVCEAIQEVLNQTFDILRIIMLDNCETLCDNCDTILRNIEKSKQGEPEYFNKYCSLIAAQFVNGIGVSMRERGGSICETIANYVDELAIKLCEDPTMEDLEKCSQVLEESKNVFRNTLKPVSVKVLTTNTCKPVSKQIVMPKYNEPQMESILNLFKEEEEAREDYIIGYFDECANALSKEFQKLTEKYNPTITTTSIDVTRLFSEVKFALDAIRKTKGDLALENNPHQSINFDELNKFCDNLLTNTY
ncbi:Uncharacterized protein QTN25_002892 [Entamoeba marina]